MYIRGITFLVFLVNVSVCALAQAKNTPVASYQQCVSCHGEQAQGNDVLKAPVLAGQYSWYLQRQLNNFANGSRGQHSQDILGQQMSAIAKTISSAEQSMIVNYLEKLPAKKNKAEAEIKGDLKNGSRYYQARCGACHGGNAQGNKTFNAPKLAGQSSKYLLRQMNNFKQGIRGTVKEDKYGRQMAMMAKTVSEKQLKDILFFISQEEITNTPIENKSSGEK